MDLKGRVLHPHKIHGTPTIDKHYLCYKWYYKIVSKQNNNHLLCFKFGCFTLSLILLKRWHDSTPQTPCTPFSWKIFCTYLQGGLLILHLLHADQVPFPYEGIWLLNTCDNYHADQDNSQANTGPNDGDRNEAQRPKRMLLLFHVARKEMKTKATHPCTWA